MNNTFLKSKIGGTGLVLILAMFVILPLPAQMPDTTGLLPGFGKPQSHVPDELLIQFSPHSSHAMRNDAIASRGAAKLEELHNSGWVRVRLPKGENINAALNRFRQDPSIALVQPNYIYTLQAIPNDPSYGQLWGLKNSGQTVSGFVYSTNNPGTSGFDMNMEAAWSNITNCNTVQVAVIDTGINYNHSDLAANMWAGGTCVNESNSPIGGGCPGHGWDYVDSDSNPVDEHGHGTHVAGTIGAVGNNSTGVTGVCWNVKLMAVRAMNANGQGTTADLAKAILFAVYNGAKVINMSLGGNVYDFALHSAIITAKTNDVVIVTAAGNEGSNNESKEVFPCNFPESNIVCVAALDQSYSLASFSNYGLLSVDVGAPGTNILSSIDGTTSITYDDFTSWGPADSLWGKDVTGANCSGINMLTIPANFCSAGSPAYSANADQQIYIQYTISSSATGVYVGFYYISFLEAGTDHVYGQYTTSGNPFPGGTQFIDISLYDAGGYAYIPLTSCVGQSTCTVGFRLVSDPTVQYYGVGIFGYEFKTKTLSSNDYVVQMGTSMATPHVAGLAALLKAFNADYTADDVANSIKNGGDSVSSLAGKTTMGKAVDGFGSLKYIAPPDNVSATY